MKKICVLIGMILSFLITGGMIHAKESHMQQDLSEEVFRFHVLANSDSDEDQALKMQVKEAVIAYMKQEIPSSDGVEMTKVWAKEHIQEIANLSKQVVKQEGYDYAVKARVTRCDFPEKSYGDITFPAGEYEALRIEIGEGKGQNWWCVLYPNLCFTDAVHAVIPDKEKKELENVLEEDTYERITATTRFRIGWFFF